MKSLNSIAKSIVFHFNLHSERIIKRKRPTFAPASRVSLVAHNTDA